MAEIPAAEPRPIKYISNSPQLVNMRVDTMPLTQLLQRAADAETSEEYEQVINHTANRLVAIARRMLRSNPRLRRWEETDDVFQDAAMRLFRALQAAKPKTSREFYGLAALQIRRTLIDLARHHFGPQGAAGRYQSDPFMHEGNQSGPVDQSNEPQSLAHWTAFHVAVDDLPEDERMVFEAVFYGDANYGDVAELLGVTRRTVIRRMNRARVKLARHVVSTESLLVDP